MIIMRPPSSARLPSGPTCKPPSLLRREYEPGTGLSPARGLTWRELEERDGPWMWCTECTRWEYNEATP